MPASRTVMLSQVVGNVIGIILSIFIVTPLCISLFKFKLNCLLFSYGHWTLNNTELVPEVKWASTGYCSFVITIGALMLILCSIQIYRLLQCLIYGRDFIFITPIIEAGVYVLMTGFMMYAALVVTLGFMTWCNFMQLRYRTCEEGDNENIDGVYEDYFDDFVTVEVVVWLAFAVCVSFTGYSLHKLYLFNSSGNYPDFSPEERQPLLNSGGVVD